MQSLSVCAFTDAMTRHPRLSLYSIFKSKFYNCCFFLFFITPQPPPAQTMVQALELLYALGGKKQGDQLGAKVKRRSVLHLQH